MRTYDHGRPIVRFTLAPLASVWLIAAALMMGVYVNPPHAITVEFPDARGEKTALGTDRLEIRIAVDDSVIFDGRPVTDSEMSKLLRARLSQGWQGMVVFTPQPHVSYKRALKVLGVIFRNGGMQGRFCFDDI